MPNLQEVFDRIQKSKKRQKEIRDMYNEALSGTPEYGELNDKLKVQRERKKQIEQTVKESFSKELTELEDIKVDIESDNELISDMSLTQLVKGETVAVKDQYENEYEPIFSVRFKKVK
ncbi:MAG: hypothetical protein AAB390_00785 [Patescibacteria group bacterium]